MTEANSYQKSPWRSRREWEDTLLHARTGIFLGISGLAVQKPTVPLAIAIAFVNFLWILSSFQSWEVIRSLAQKSQDDEGQADVHETLGGKCIHLVFRPTLLIAVCIPALAHVAWLIYLASCVTRIAAVSAALLPYAVLLLLHVEKRKT